MTSSMLKSSILKILQSPSSIKAELFIIDTIQLQKSKTLQLAMAQRIYVSNESELLNINAAIIRQGATTAQAYLRNELLTLIEEAEKDGWVAPQDIEDNPDLWETSLPSGENIAAKARALLWIGRLSGKKTGNIGDLQYKEFPVSMGAEPAWHAFKTSSGGILTQLSEREESPSTIYMGKNEIPYIEDIIYR